MFLALWNYLRGYVIISVSGFSVERFVNLAAYKGIYLWDIRPSGSSVLMRVRAKQFFRLRECARKTGCKYKISARAGLPFKINEYKKRKAYSVGILAFVIMMYLLSAMVWTVEINGNKRVTSEDILVVLKEEGLAAGRLKHGLDIIGTSNVLLERFADISWVAINIKGTAVKVDIVETIPKTTLVDRQTPCDVVSAKDAVVVSIAAYAGTPQVNVGDVVQAGEVLISSIIYLKDGEQVMGEALSHAGGSIKGKVWYDLEKCVMLKYDDISYTGNTKKDYSLNAFESNINFIRPRLSDGEYENGNSSEKYFKIGDYSFPIGIRIDEYKEIVKEEKLRTLEEARLLIDKELEEAITELEIKEGGQLDELKSEYFEDEEMIKLTARVALIEELAVQKNIDTLERGTVDE